MQYNPLPATVRRCNSGSWFMIRQGKQYEVVQTYALAWRAKAAANRLGLKWTPGGNGFAVIREQTTRKD